MRRTLAKFFLTGLLCVTLLGAWTTAQARPPQTPAAQSSAAQSTKSITLPFNKTTDRKAQLPRKRPVSNQPYDDGRVVIGADNRSPVLNRAYPWSAIGRLEWQTANGQMLSHCTATLIGEDLLLTNSHCLERPVRNPKTGAFVVDASGEPVYQFTDSQTYSSISDRLVFKPSLIQGVSLDAAKVVRYRSGWTKKIKTPENDWALLKIDQRLGSTERYGYLGWRTLDFSKTDVRQQTFDKLLLAGYSGDFPTDKLREFGQPGDTAGADVACSILDTSQKLLWHDCDTNPGASGSAIFALFSDGGYSILGLHAGSNPLQGKKPLPDGVDTSVINLGVSVAQWSQQALSMR